MTDADRIFLFFGEDIEDLGPEPLRRHHEDGFIIVPLNASAFGMAGKARVPFIPLDGFMGIESFIQARNDADRWAAEWFLSAKDALTSSDICWPRFDRETMHWFWRDIAAAMHFATAFLQKGGRAVELYTNQNPRPGLYYYASDTHAVLIKAMLGEKARLISRPEMVGGRRLLKTLGIRFGETAEKPRARARKIEGKIVLALNPGECHRFQPLIRDLIRHFPGRVAVVMLFPNPAETTALVDTFSIPVVVPQLTEKMNTALVDRFQGGYQKLQTAVDYGNSQYVLRHLAYHFAYYCLHRWPVMDGNFKAWTDLWAAGRPDAVIVSSLPDGESQLPAEAAMRIGIPTFSIPHCEFSPREEFIVDIDHALCNISLSKNVLRNSGYSDGKIEICKEIIHVDEHRTVPGQVAALKKNWNVLVLTYPVTGSHFASSGSVTAQLQALNALGNPPEEILDRLAMVIKPHPGEPETELFSAVGGGLSDRVCHPKIILQELLAGTDLVIALNCSYSVIIHTLRFGKPVIFFFTDPFYLNGVGTHEHAHLLVPAGIKARNRDELWGAVGRFFTEKAFADALTSKALTFAREKLDDRLLPTIGKVVKGCLAGHGEPSVDRDRSKTPTIPAIPMNRILPEHENLSVVLVDGRQDYGELLPEEVVAICKLARRTRPKRIFEFGTFKGGTTLRLAANTEAEIVTFDLPPKGHPDFSDRRMDDPDLDVYPETPGIRFHDTPYAGRIRQVYGDSQTFDFTSYFGTMDFVFVDACHHYEYALRDSMNAFKMIRPGGIIVWHDYAEWAPGVMRALNAVNRRYPLRHISGTSLVVYTGEGGGVPLNDFPDRKGDTSLAAPTDRPYDAAADRADLLERIAESPGDVDALVDLARLEAACGNGADAQAFLQDALILDPAHEGALLLKASIGQS